VLRPPLPLHLRPLLELVNQVTVGLLPPPVRRMYGFSWDPLRSLALHGGAEYVKGVVMPVLERRSRDFRRPGPPRILALAATQSLRRRATTVRPRVADGPSGCPVRVCHRHVAGSAACLRAHSTHSRYLVGCTSASGAGSRGSCSRASASRRSSWSDATYSNAFCAYHGATDSSCHSQRRRQSTCTKPRAAKSCAQNDGHCSLTCAVPP
jgi:hypothetical protein